MPDCRLLTGASDRLRRAQRPSFENVAAAAGMTFTHTNGASADKYLVETMGSGGVFFDYDNDGWIDLFLVDGGSIADSDGGRARASSPLSECRQGGVSRTYRSRRASGTASTAWVHARATSTTMARTDLYITNYGPNDLVPKLGKRRVHGHDSCVPASGLRGGARVVRSSTSMSTATSTCS